MDGPAGVRIAPFRRPSAGLLQASGRPRRSGGAPCPFCLAPPGAWVCAGLVAALLAACGGADDSSAPADPASTAGQAARALAAPADGGGTPAGPGASAATGSHAHSAWAEASTGITLLAASRDGTQLALASRSDGGVRVVEAAGGRVRQSWAVPAGGRRRAWPSCPTARAWWRPAATPPCRCGTANAVPQGSCSPAPRSLCGRWR
jgi:hypothetical protein